MTSSSMIDLISSTPQVRQMGRVFVNGAWQESMNASQKANVVGDFLPIVTGSIVMRGAWDFAIKESTVSGNGVKSQSDYTLDEHSDITGVYQVMYDNKELVKKSRGPLNDYLTHYSVTGVAYWTPYGRSGRSPIIRLTSAPTESGKEIRYVHWIRVSYDDLPDQFDKAVISGVQAMMQPKFQANFEHEIRVLLDDYGLTDVEVEPVASDRMISHRDRRRTQRIGYGGV